MNEQILKLRKHIKRLISEQLSTDRRMVTELEELDKSIKSIDKDYRALINNSFSRIVLDDGQGGKLFDVQLYPVMDITKEGMGKYDVRAYFHDSDRVYMKGMSCEEICEFIKGDMKKCVEDENGSYVRKLLEKGKRPSWVDEDYEYKPTLVAEGKSSRKFDTVEDAAKYYLKQAIREKNPEKAAFYNYVLDTKPNAIVSYERYKGSAAWDSWMSKNSDLISKWESRIQSQRPITEVKQKKEDKCSCEDTVGEMEEVKKTERQEDHTSKDLPDVKFEELLPGLSLEEFADKVENAVWGAIKRMGEEKHTKTAKAEHDSKNLDTKKNGHTVTKQKRHSKKTKKLDEKPKKHETSHASKGKDTKVNTPNVKDFKSDNRKAKKDGKDEEYTPAKKS